MFQYITFKILELHILALCDIFGDTDFLNSTFGVTFVKTISLIIEIILGNAVKNKRYLVLVQIIISAPIIYGMIEYIIFQIIKYKKPSNEFNVCNSESVNLP